MRFFRNPLPDAQEKPGGGMEPFLLWWEVLKPCVKKHPPSLLLLLLLVVVGFDFFR